MIKNYSMKISNRTIYGIKLMLLLAAEYESKVVSLNEIAESENISLKFLENIISAIKKKGLVKVKRGAKGGYSLSRPAEKITMKEILDALETDLLKDEWLSREPATASEIAIQKSFKELDRVIKSFLEQETLDKLVQHYGTLKPGQMFYI
jgi:Rrf2 family transcriptional regulator, cysteine metabolism repressor